MELQVVHHLGNMGVRVFRPDGSARPMHDLLIDLSMALRPACGPSPYFVGRGTKPQHGARPWGPRYMAAAGRIQARERI